MFNSKTAKFYILLSVLTPSFFGYLGLNKGQMLYLIIMFFFTFSSLLFNFKYYKNIKINKVHVFFICAFIILFIEYAVSSIINFSANNYVDGDIIEIFRPIIYCTFYVFSVFIINDLVSEIGALKTLKYFENIIFYTSFIEWFKFIKLLYPFFKLYTIFPFGSINFIRFSGLTGFAYNYAWILCICLAINMISSKKINFRFIYYSFLIFMTGSRTGFLALLITYLLIFVNFKRTRFFLLLSLFFISALIFILYFLGVEFIKTSVDYIIRLILAMLGKSSDGSFVTRMAQNNIAMEGFNESPLVGIASNKAENMVIENFYFHHLRNWGLLGLCTYILILIAYFILAAKRNSLLIKFILIAGFIICFSSPVFDQVRNFNIFYLLMSVLMSKKINNQKEVKINVFRHSRNLQWLKFHN